MIDVFVSAGRAVKPEQEAFLSALEDLLRVHGLNPHNLGRNDFSIRSPLGAVEDLMSKCSGTIVVAYERILIRDGVQLTSSGEPISLSDCALPTVWNQLEAAMAFSLNHPLLVIVDVNVKKEGMLSRGHDWHVQEVTIDAATLQTREFLGMFADWTRRVTDFHESSQSSVEKRSGDPIDVSTLSFIQILKCLTTGQLWAVASAVLGLLAAVAFLGYRIGLLVASQ